MIFRWIVYAFAAAVVLFGAARLFIELYALPRIVDAPQDSGFRVAIVFGAGLTWGAAVIEW